MVVLSHVQLRDSLWGEVIAKANPCLSAVEFYRLFVSIESEASAPIIYYNTPTYWQGWLNDFFYKAHQPQWVNYLRGNSADHSDWTRAVDTPVRQDAMRIPVLSKIVQQAEMVETVIAAVDSGTLLLSQLNNQLKTAISYKTGFSDADITDDDLGGSVFIRQAQEFYTRSSERMNELTPKASGRTFHLLWEAGDVVSKRHARLSMRTDKKYN